MKLLLYIISLLLCSNLVHGLVGQTSLREQVQQSDVVARIVVVEIAKLKFASQEELTFTGVAKCRVVADYTGALANLDFIYIPCDYNFDESPSPLEVGSDYIACLALMKKGGVAHPVSHDSVHEIIQRTVENPESEAEDKDVTIQHFKDLLMKHWKSRKQNK